jgi:epoxyqueuosine reductase
MKSSELKGHALTLGFDACGVAPATALPELAFLEKWLARGYGGTMTYLHRSAKRRADVRHVMPSAQSVIVTATNYNTARPYSIESADRAQAHIARYAWGDDYHDIIERRLSALVEWMRANTAEPFEARAYVDTGPVQERVYAQYAGLGWIGKNTCLIHPELGSFVFLAAVICSLPLDVDPPALDRCGTCTLCIEACPTQAIVGPAVLDATRCISYLTIEYRGEIPEALRPGIGAHVYGCDVCQEVCPWNAVSPRSDDAAWQPRRSWDRVDLKTLASRTDAELESALDGSAMNRTKAQGLRRNLAVAVANSETS